MTQTRSGRMSEQEGRRTAGRAGAPGQGAQAARRHARSAASARERPTQERPKRNRTSKAQTKGHKRKKRKGGIWKKLLVVILILAMLGGLGYLAVVGFQLKKITVLNNRFTSTEEVTGWISQDRYSTNTLYVWWKYNHADLSALPAVESVHVEIKSPQEVTVDVTEKVFIGRVEMNGEFFYFDKKGIISYKSAEVLYGVPLISGMEPDAEKTQVGKELPISDKAVFEKIEEVSGLLAQNELRPDGIEIVGTELSLWFGGVKILLGDAKLSLRVEQISPILKKLNELYPGQNGVLHLEKYEQGTEFIRFEPERG